MREFYVYLKLQQFNSDTDLQVDTIPLRATSVSISTDKTIPDFAVPFSGLATGESTTLALDLGMSSKTVQISGFINATTLKRSHTGSSARVFTPHEIAQIIAAGVDSTGLAKYQAFDELVVLIPSYVGSDYNYRAGVNASNPTSTSEADTPLIPFNFTARGDSNQKDNKNVVFASSFPDSTTATGMKGYVRSFSVDFAAETVELSFTMQFVVATVIP
jgi:hypothetical protein